MNKIIATAALLAALSTSSYAQDMFAFMGEQDETNTILIEPLTATGDGYVAVFDYHTGEPGELLGAMRVREGANRQLRVQTGHTVRRDVIAYLFIGDDFMDPSKAVDSVEIEIDNDN